MPPKLRYHIVAC